MSADLQDPRFTNEAAAREAMEALLWPNGPVCPHCGCAGKTGRVEGPSARPGLYYCGGCKKQFTVTVGTIFERSKVPLSKWWMAIHLMASSKKGMSAHQLHRMLGVAYQTAWFMEHRIRGAMRDGALAVRGAPPIFSHEETPPLKWFRGVVAGSFEGTLQAIDIRGAVPECALVVGPSNQIDCVFKEEDIGKVGSALATKSRVKVTGRAIYDGRSGLPARVEIREIEEIDKRGVDFLHWRGAFEPFEVEEWEDNLTARSPRSSKRRDQKIEHRIPADQRINQN